MNNEAKNGGKPQSQPSEAPQAPLESDEAFARPASPAREETAKNILQLPGLAAISLYMSVLACVVAVGVVGHHYPPLFLILALAFFTASFGLMRLLRWAWALTLAAVGMIAAYCLWLFSAQHQGSALVQGLLNLVFFLYLVRIEVREKLR